MYLQYDVNSVTMCAGHNFTVLVQSLCSHSVIFISSSQLF